MKKRPDIADLAATLSEAASKPLVPSAVMPPGSRKRGSIAVFLKVPPDLHAKLDHEAINRTKETGKGVTVQQVILEKLQGDDMSNIVYIGGRKGGSGKTTTAHLLCLGAILRQPAAYILTDPHRSLKHEGRPYSVMDGRDVNTLAKIISSSHNIPNGWFVIDGEETALEFDRAIAAQADLTVLPFRNSAEDTDSVKRDLDEIPDALAWPTAWPTNVFARSEAQTLMDDLLQNYPDRVIPSPVEFVNSSNELLAHVLDNPSTRLRSAARNAYTTMTDVFERLHATSNITALRKSVSKT